MVKGEWDSLKEGLVSLLDAPLKDILFHETVGRDYKRGVRPS